MDLDAINRELADVADALLATPDDDYATRHRLRQRQDELREMAAAFHSDHDVDRPTDDLMSELDALEAQRSAIFDSGIDLVTQAGGGSSTGGSFTSAGEGMLNSRIREASGLTSVETRIAKLRAILASRRGSDTAPAGPSADA